MSLVNAHLEQEALVSLVGAGPGDAELITVKGLNRLRHADVVVYDKLANEALLREAPENATMIFAGKGPGNHALSQEQINSLLVEHGSQGKRVVRLKGGDPFVFGRGGEEAEALAGAGIRFEVVPGVTSAIAAPAYAGIPVTHRDYTSAFTVVTGHEDPTKDESTIPWHALAHGPDTLVFLMGVSHLANLAQRLIIAGRPPSTPVAVVRRGTWPDQQSVHGTLENIADRVREIGITAPAVAIVGKVTTLASSLAWNRNGGLAGKSVLVTRARDQASALTKLLASFGAVVTEFPAIQIVPAHDYTGLDRALRELVHYRWVCFTSVNAVAAIGRRLDAVGLGWAELAKVRVAAIGPATARALSSHTVTVDYMPARFLAEAIAGGLPDLDGGRVLLARADIADSRLVHSLEARGATVDEFIAYRTVVSDEDAGAIRQRLRDGAIDVVTFASSSTVSNLCQALGPNGQELLASSVVACIGPVTAETARGLGITPAVVATEHTIPGLVTAIREYYAR
jgi:uroporphyrinogen III methyltransferase / synthase